MKFFLVLVQSSLLVVTNYGKDWFIQENLVEDLDETTQIITDSRKKGWWRSMRKRNIWDTDCIDST